jgi:hypothetical protein
MQKRLESVMSDIASNVIKTPFSPYDVFAYLIPGSAALSLVYIFEIKISQNSNSMFTPVSNFFRYSHSHLIDANWAISLLYFLSIVVLAYVLGHIFASISALLIDRILVHKGYGYPFRYLLDIPNDENTIYTRPFYRGLYCWINILIISVYVPALILIKEKYEFNTLINFLFVSKYIFYFLIFISIVKLLASNPFIFSLFRKRGLNIIGFPFHFLLLYLISLPYDIFSNLLSKYIRTERGFHDEFKEAFKTIFRKCFKMEVESAHTNAYWLPYCHIAEKSPKLLRIAINWLNLYSFCRNLSAALFVVSLYCAGSILFQGNNINDKDRLFSYWLPPFLYGGSVLLLIRYYYLYASYYTKFLLRAFVYFERDSLSDLNP